MDRSSNVTQIALGVMLGNLGCFLLWVVFSCITFVFLNVVAGAWLASFTRSFR